MRRYLENQITRRAYTGDRMRRRANSTGKEEKRIEGLRRRMENGKWKEVRMKTPRQKLL